MKDHSSSISFIRRFKATECVYVNQETVEVRDLDVPWPFSFAASGPSLSLGSEAAAFPGADKCRQLSHDRRQIPNPTSLQPAHALDRSHSRASKISMEN